jgi:hypothetical protein
MTAPSGKQADYDSARHSSVDSADGENHIHWQDDEDIEESHDSSPAPRDEEALHQLRQRRYVQSLDLKSHSLELCMS